MNTLALVTGPSVPVRRRIAFHNLPRGWQAASMEDSKPQNAIVTLTLFYLNCRFFHSPLIFAIVRS